MKRIFVSVYVLMLSLIAKTQEPYGKVTISSPTAASLGKYADIPVGYHTGTPEISIPIYTIKEGALSLPIRMNYHASGLKKDELASWVGLGWSLNAGGVITRTVKSTPDEKLTNAYTNNTKGHLSDGGYNSYLFEWEQYSPLTSHDAAWFNNINEGKYDGEPDLFVFNFAGHTGKFYFHDDGTPVLVPEGDYKISYSYTPGMWNSIASFVITTNDGTTYHFGRTAATNDVDPVELTHFFGEQNNYGTNAIISSWFLNKVTSADGLFSITLSYTAEEFKYVTVNGFQVDGGTYGRPNFSLSPNQTVTPSGPPPYEYELYENWQRGVRLTQISYTNGKLDFEPGPARQDLKEATASSLPAVNEVVNTQAKTLGSIRVSDNANNYCTRFVFAYSYFEDNTSPLPEKYNSTAWPLTIDRKRLRLDSLWEESCTGGLKVPAHKFEYFGETVQRRINLGVDHWGFFNGEVNSGHLIPTFIEESAGEGIIEKPGVNRESAWPAMRGGSLRKITYPTGGSSVFEFEPNTTWINYNKPVATLRHTFSVSYDGSPYPATQYITCSGNPYKFKLVNSAAGGDAFVHVYNNTTGAFIGYVTATPGQTKEKSFNLPAGVYRIELSKSNPSTGNGASCQVHEWVPNQVTENRIVGGIRIKSITHNDGISGVASQINYAYDDPATGRSNGILYSRPTYVTVIRNDYLKTAGFYQNVPGGTGVCSANGCAGCDIGQAQPYIKSPNTLRPMENTQGNHIGYNEVKVSQTNNGYSIYRYYGSNLFDLVRDDVSYRYVNTTGCNMSIPNYPYPPIPFESKRGNLKYEGHYNQSGQVISETDYFINYAENPRTTPCLSVSTAVGLIGLPTFYDLKTFRVSQTSKTERTLGTGGNYLVRTTTSFYESPWHHQVTKVVTTNSKAESVETKYKYAQDFRITACDNITDGFSAYQASLGNCLTQYYQDMATCTDNYCKYWNYQKYLKCKSELRKTYIQARKNYLTPTYSGGYPICFENARNNANTDLKPVLELQNRNMIIPLEISSWKNGSLTGSAFTKYEYSTTLPTMVYPAKVEKINLTTPSASFNPATISGNGLSKDTRYADEATVKINNGNVAEVVGKDGVVTSYIWGYGNTYPIAKAVGANYSTLSAAYTAVGQNLSLLRTYSTLSNALVSTYTYTPGIGIISETDPRGRKIYYEYDKLNRLVLVRDNDNNIVKWICYNYAGQPENCLPTSPPPVCTTANCTGNDKKCINGICETGIRINISSVYFRGKWTCTYKYVWSDGSESPLYTEVTTTPCPLVAD